jgi:4-amino-4-deoxy-L-arabinose transferase-like glycosyltransferase
LEQLLGGRNNFYKFLAVLTLFKLIIIAVIPITPQEAYYWYYSQNPDLSYFDHPPAAAYSIWLGTQLFGDTVFGVKFMAVIWSLFINVLLYFITLRYFQKKGVAENKNSTAFTVVLLYNLTVAASMYSILTVPDSPLMLFWFMIVFSVQEYTITYKRRWWVIAGICLGLALASKYSAIIITGSIFLYLIFSKEYRYLLLTPYPYLALVIGAVVFSPVIYWNASHEWASFKFQFVERAQAQKPLQLTYLIQLIISQLFMLTPLVFVFFIKGIYKYVRNFRQHTDLNLLFFTGIIIIAIFSYVSLKSLVKMNWLLPGYLSLFVLTVVILNLDLLRKSIWLKIGIGFSLFLIIVGFSILILPNVPLGEGNTWSGWSDAGPRIYEHQKKLGGRANCFIFSNGYKSAALTKFYLPDQQDTYAENIYGGRGLQFDYWGIPDSLRGKDALYIFTDRHEYDSNLDQVRKYFDSVEILEEFEYNFSGSHTRSIYCYLARNYRGP